jgi:hypothetical protein
MNTLHSKTKTVRYAAGVLAALLLAAVPAPALAGAHHPHPSRTKGKKKAPVLVRCASLTVTCHAHHGPQGPAGPPGPPGASGAAGLPGESIAARIRSTTAVETTSGPTAVSLSAASFEHTEGQDERLLGEATVTFPPGKCSEGSTKDPEEGKLEGIVLLDEQLAGAFIASGVPYTPGATDTVPIVWLASGLGVAGIFQTYPLSSVEPTSSYSLKMMVGDDCKLAGATHFTVDSVAIDVLADG